MSNLCLIQLCVKRPLAETVSLVLSLQSLCLYDSMFSVWAWDPPLLWEETHQSKLGEIPLLLFLSFQVFNVTFQTLHMIKVIFQRNGKPFTLLLKRSINMPLNHSSSRTALSWSGSQWMFSLSWEHWVWDRNTSWTGRQYITEHPPTHTHPHDEIINPLETYVLWCTESTSCIAFQYCIRPCRSQNYILYSPSGNFWYISLPCGNLHTETKVIPSSLRW